MNKPKKNHSEEIENLSEETGKNENSENITENTEENNSGEITINFQNYSSDLYDDYNPWS